MSGVDFERLFAAVPSALLVMDLDLRILDANPAYCRLLGRSRDDMLGHRFYELFPDNPDDVNADGVKAVLTSLEATRDTGEVQSLPLQRYDILDTDTGRYVKRYWSIVNSPVRDRDGELVLLLNRVEDVSSYVRARTGESGSGSSAWKLRAALAEAEVYVRSRELQAASATQAQTARRIAALAEVAVAVSTAESVAEVADLVIGRGIAAWGANGGAVAVRDGDELALTITESLGAGAARDHARLPLDGPLPASVACATGRRVLLPDAAAAHAFAPEMAQVQRDTGCSAWVALPLRVGGTVLGSLTVGWADPHPFPEAEVELLDAFAAHCAQGIDRVRARRAERAVAQSHLRMAETLQRSLLTPPAQPDHLQVAVRYRPAARGAQVGGDWYDAFLTPAGELCLVVGDVTGHDRVAVAAMGQIRNLVRGLAFGIDGSPAEVLTAVDRAMTHYGVGVPATAVLAQIEQAPADAARGVRRLRWSNAGHPPPLVLHPDGTAALLGTVPELLLGLRAGRNATRTDHEAELPTGATLVLCTDGLFERRGVDLDHGLADLLRAVREVAADDLEAWCDELLDRMGLDGDDDVAVLALRAG